ncbi:MAG: DUF3526 domain-containing protein [Parvularculaceae bacterium]
MKTFDEFARELGLFLRSRAAVGVAAAAFALSSFAVWAGLGEVAAQRAEIAALLKADAADREEALAGQSDYGGAAYYSFHLTYDPPSDLAFAALGARDVFPWKHRIRMLALEGQIYETDGANPELAGIGRFDYAFVVAMIAPLLAILLLYDLRAGERAAGRHELLVATGGDRVWLVRTAVRCFVLLSAIVVPFVIGAVIAATSASSALAVVAMTAAHILFWAAIAFMLARASLSGPTTATTLAGLWLAVSFVIPSLSETAIAQAIPSPAGGEIVLQQREAVNDAWDLPKDATMDAFVARRPEFAATAAIDKPFEWKWYYAFQQVGDQSVEDLSRDYRAALRKRYDAAGVAALASPPALVMRTFTRLAETDALAALAYEARVRTFHRQLREFYYPLLFNDVEYAPAAFDDMPAFGDENVAPEKIASKTGDAEQ